METLRLLADPTRFHLLTLLMNHDLCVGALASRLNISRSAVSQHLQILRKAGWVRGEKRGYWTHYTLNKEAVRSLAAELLAWIEQPSLPRQVCVKSLPMAKPQRKKETEPMSCNDCCQQPTLLKNTPEECTPEQILRCHGQAPGHPCLGKQKKKGKAKTSRVQRKPSTR